MLGEYHNKLIKKQQFPAVLVEWTALDSFESLLAAQGKIPYNTLKRVRVSIMSTQNSPAKKPLVKLPFPIKQEQEANADSTLEDVRPKPQRYADRTWMPPRGTRRSMGKR